MRDDQEDGRSCVRGSSRRERGLRAETIVARYLEQRGYCIVATNLRLGYLEIDIVARQGPVVAVVEVRTRSAASWTTAFGSIDDKKRRRLRHAGERLWNRRYRHDPSVERLRFDVAAVRVDGAVVSVEHVIAAF